MAHIKKGEIRTTEQQQADVLDIYADIANITEACKKAKVPRRTFYNWLELSEFKAKFKALNAVAVGVLEDEARRRAITGTLKPVFYKGDKVGTIREYSDTLLIVLLKAHAPKKYKDRHELTGKNGKPIKTENTIVVKSTLKLT